MLLYALLFIKTTTRTALSLDSSGRHCACVAWFSSLVVLTVAPVTSILLVIKAMISSNDFDLSFARVQVLSQKNEKQSFRFVRTIKEKPEKGPGKVKKLILVVVHFEGCRDRDSAAVQNV